MTPFPSSTTPPTAGWEPSDFIAILAVVVSAIVALSVAFWSHRHDLQMREKDFDEQRKAREDERKEKRKRLEEERQLAWIVQTQQLCADTRGALLSNLDIDALKIQADESLQTVRKVWDFDLRGRFSLISNFANSTELRQAATHASNQIIRYLSRIGAVSRRDPVHPDYSDQLNRAHRAYGEAHYALDQLVHVAGGPPPTSRDAYFWALDTDP